MNFGALEDGDGESSVRVCLDDRGCQLGVEIEGAEYHRFHAGERIEVHPSFDGPTEWIIYPSGYAVPLAGWLLRYSTDEIHRLFAQLCTLTETSGPWVDLLERELFFLPGRDFANWSPGEILSYIADDRLRAPGALQLVEKWGYNAEDFLEEVVPTAAGFFDHGIEHGAFSEQTVRLLLAAVPSLRRIASLTPEEPPLPGTSNRYDPVWRNAIAGFLEKWRAMFSDSGTLEERWGVARWHPRIARTERPLARLSITLGPGAASDDLWRFGKCLIEMDLVDRVPYSVATGYRRRDAVTIFLDETTISHGPGLAHAIADAFSPEALSTPGARTSLPVLSRPGLRISPSESFVNHLLPDPGCQLTTPELVTAIFLLAWYEESSGDGTAEECFESLARAAMIAR